MTSGCDKLHRGAAFHRCALQVNPFAYARTYRGIKAPGNPESHAREMIAKALEIGVSVFAITDHNSVSSVTVFRRGGTGSHYHLPGLRG